MGRFISQFNCEIGLCTEAPDENHRRAAIINSIAGLPQIKFEMEKVLKANPDVSFFELMQALKSCEVLMPKKQPAVAAAISTLSMEEDLMEKIAQRLLSIRADTGRGGGRGGAPKTKSDMTCYFCGNGRTCEKSMLLF